MCDFFWEKGHRVMLEHPLIISAWAGMQTVQSSVFRFPTSTRVWSPWVFPIQDGHKVFFLCDTSRVCSFGCRSQSTTFPSMYLSAFDKRYFVLGKSELHVGGSIDDNSKIFFCISQWKYMLWPSSELSRRDGSDDRSQNMFLWRNMANCP